MAGAVTARTQATWVSAGNSPKPGPSGSASHAGSDSRKGPEGSSNHCTQGAMRLVVANATASATMSNSAKNVRGIVSSPPAAAGTAADTAPANSVPGRDAAAEPGFEALNFSVRGAKERVDRARYVPALV